MPSAKVKIEDHREIEGLEDYQDKRTDNNTTIIEDQISDRIKDHLTTALTEPTQVKAPKNMDNHRKSDHWVEGDHPIIIITEDHIRGWVLMRD